MAVNERVMPIPRAAVWSALGDGHRYGDWVVGTSQIRDVDAAFPAAGTSLHYTIGWGPFRHDGDTEVLDVTEGERLVLEAKGWPAGSMRIELRLYEAPAGCRVWMSERPARGVAALLHNPLQDAVLHVRNIACLRRLQGVALEHAGRQGSGRPQR